MDNVKVRLQPIAGNLNLPTVLKTAILPGDTIERLFIVTQVGEIYDTDATGLHTFLDIRPLVLTLGQASGGYDERGLLGLAFHPGFHYNGLFYLHYSVTGSQGPGTIRQPFIPDPCDESTLNLQWNDRDTRYDHIDTVEEWIYQGNKEPQRRRTLLTIRRPFLNHNGVNSLNFSPETGNLILTTGDGGAGYDPFNLSQNDMEIAGKMIEIDVNKDVIIDNMPVVTRFDELPDPVQETLYLSAKGIRNSTGISFQGYYNQYIKYTGNVGQDLVESIFSYIEYRLIPITQITKSAKMNSLINMDGLINYGWRGFEGDFPTTVIRSCQTNAELQEKVIAYYTDAVRLSVQRILPMTCYYHEDNRPNKFGGTALTGVSPYMGENIPGLTGSVVFTDLARDEDSPPPARGALAYTRLRSDCRLNDYGIIETDYDFGSQSAYYVSLGANINQSTLYLGVYGSIRVADRNLGTVYEIIP